jgi:hypothetical protein
MNIKKAIRTFLNPKKVYVFGKYLQVYCSYIVSILFVFRNIFTYCTYLHVTMRLALFHALHTYKYVQYVHILTRIRAYTYTKYVPNTCKYIRSYMNVSAGICMYMSVYACIYYQQVAGVMGKLCAWLVFVCI